MLLFNGRLSSTNPLTILGDGWQNFVGDTRALSQSNIEAFSKLSAYPDGYYPPHCMIIARSAGRLRSNFTAVGSGALIATLQSGRNITATTNVTGEGSITSAELAQLILLVASLTGSGTVTNATTQALAGLVAAINGSGNVTAAAAGLLEMVSSISGSGTITTNNTFLASMQANLRGFGDLTPEGIRDAVWAAVLEAGLSSSDLLRLIAAATQGSATGLEDGSPVFKSIDGTQNRIVATYSAGTRTVTSRDAN